MNNDSICENKNLKALVLSLDISDDKTKENSINIGINTKHAMPFTSLDKANEYVEDLKLLGIQSVAIEINELTDNNTNIEQEIRSDIKFALEKLVEGRKHLEYIEPISIESTQDRGIRKIIYNNFKDYNKYLDLVRGSLNTYTILNRDTKSEDIEFLQIIIDKIQIELNEFKSIKEYYKEKSCQEVINVIKIFNDLTIFEDRMKENLEIWKRNINKNK